jgi:hypothetical protein
LVDAVEDELHGRNSAMTYARLLEPRGTALDDQPELRPGDIVATRNKRTRCDAVEEATSDCWRRCAPPARTARPQ